MKKLFTVALGLTFAALAVSAALAQQQRGGYGGFGGGNVLSLLTQKSVQEELKLTEDQITKVTDLQKSQRGSFNFKDLKDLSKEDRAKKAEERTKATDTALSSILNPPQLKRVKQISLQQRGMSALSDEAVATALSLTADQKEKVKALQEEMRTATSDLFKGGKGGFNEEARKKVEEARKSNNEKGEAILTADQKAKWKELAGEPFKGEITRGRRPANP
jgi:Spy/CpxP family protein refolding chaperone